MKKSSAKSTSGRTETFRVSDMVCGSCEKLVSKAALGVPGVRIAKADYSRGECEVDYDSGKATLAQIKQAIEARGYSCPAEGKPRVGGSDILPILGLVAVLYAAYVLVAPTIESYAPALSSDSSIPLLFVIGLFTGFHCIAMCGGFVIGYATKAVADGRGGIIPHIEYGLAKTFSYASIGALFGLIGSFVTFTPLLRGIAAVLAGAFLILFGLNMLGIVRAIRIRIPAILERWTSGRLSQDSSPIGIGLLNGLMIACGPLQAIYLMAAASGSPYYGALYLGAFGLGTLPMLLGFGAAASAMSVKMTHKILKYSGVVVVLLGLVMVSRGLTLSGGLDLGGIVRAGAVPSAGGANAPAVEMDSAGFQVIRMNVTLSGWQPDRFTLKTGVPVKWVIDGQQITNCNSAIQVPKYGLKFDIQKGEQTITFTPTQAGTVPWSCWMGMIPGTFIVVDDIKVAGSGQETKSTAPQAGQVADPKATSTTIVSTTTEPPTSSTSAKETPDTSVQTAAYQTIYMNVTASGWEPSSFVLKKGVPVKWVIDGQELTSCNNAIKVPSLGLQFGVKKGSQTVEFTPTASGTVPFSCSMGMLKGTFLVKDEADTSDQAAYRSELDAIPKQKSAGGGCGCGMMGGGGGCGMMNNFK